MSESVNAIISNADYFVLMLIRVSGLVISSPIFGRVNVPNIAKVGLALMLTYLFFMTFPQTEAIEYSTLIGFLLLCALEVLLGVALAYVTNIFFTLTFISGQIIDMQIGFGIVSVYDAQNRTQVPIMGNIMNLMLLIVFFRVNGHHKLIQLMHLTITELPVGRLTLSPQIGIIMLEVFTVAFMLGVMIALPVIASGLTLEIVLGMFMRAVPQVHMFVVGVPAKLLLGLAVVMLLLPAFVNFSDRVFSEMFVSVEKVFNMFLEAA